jgi:hypothetical protein
MKKLSSNVQVILSQVCYPKLEFPRKGKNHVWDCRDMA